METSVAQGGKFTFTISSKELSKGLRPHKQNPRNSDFLVVSSGAVGYKGALRVIDSLTRMLTSVITDAFPFPQLFVFTNMIIVCGQKTIYEWVNGVLVLKYTAAVAGGVWSAVDFYDYIYMSNGNIAVVRDAASNVYALSTALPKASAICNFNGQVLIGAPDVIGSGSNMMIPVDPISLTIIQFGTMMTT